MGNPYPSSNLALSTALAPYGAATMNALRGRVLYDLSGNSYPIPAAPADFALSFLFGRYVSRASATLPGQSVSGETNNGISGVRITVGFNNLNFITIGSNLIALSAVCFASAAPIGIAAGANVNSFNILVTGTNSNGTPYSNQVPPNNININNIVLINQVNIRLAGSASNNFGQTAVASRTWTYNITTSGLVGPL